TGLLEIADACQRPGRDYGWQGGSEYESWRSPTQRIDQRSRASHITAHCADGLAQRSLNDRQAMGDAVSLSHAGAALAIETNGMNLVEVSHGAMAIREIADCADGRNVAIHGIDGFKGDQLRAFHRRRFEQLGQMYWIVVPEDTLLGPAGADAVDHRG